jgi:hypothetical protein
MSQPSGRRVLIHVGTPKTGTSYLQDVLFLNRDGLAARGILYPADRFDAHFLAALDLMRLTWGGLEAEALGAWDAMAEKVRRHSGTAIISHEILATASRAQAGRALESLGHGDGTEVHVVLSVRDLVRQIPAEWQENVKHRHVLTYGAFLDRIRDPERKSRIATWFWGVQELPDILNRWGHDLPPERIHLVTVPHGGPKNLLWKRFSVAFGLDGLDLDLEAERANPSLGAPETALVRRINRAANRELNPGDYRPLVRELLAHQTLSRRTGSPRLALPPDARAWADELSRTWVAELRQRGYDVVGDLDELLPAPSTAPYADPDRPNRRQLNQASMDAIRALLVEAARMRETEADLRRELDEAHRALERAYLRPSYRAREKLVRAAEDNGWGRRAMGYYRRARGRSSRSA